MLPKILDLGAITIHTFGLVLAAAFIAGIWMTGRAGKKAGIAPDLIWNMGLIVLFSALVGSKIILLFSDLRYYTENPREIFSLSTLHATGVYYGGLFLAVGASIVFTRIKALPFWTMADLAAPGIAFGQAVAKLGCLAAGCCYGIPTRLPWGITFTDHYASQTLGVPLNIPLHPTQIYESMGALALSIFLLKRLPRKQFTGQIILGYLALYSLLRFFLEFLRGDERGFVMYGLLSAPQLIAAITVIGACAVYAVHRRRPVKVA